MCSLKPSQWGAVNISMSGGALCLREHKMEISVNGGSFLAALVLNGDGRSFMVDLNLTASLMLHFSPNDPKTCDEIAVEGIGVPCGC